MIPQSKQLIIALINIMYTKLSKKYNNIKTKYLTVSFFFYGFFCIIFIFNLIDLP